MKQVESKAIGSSGNVASWRMDNIQIARPDLTTDKFWHADTMLKTNEFEISSLANTQLEH